MQRDLYVDLIKGIGVLAIILIHTTFYSGDIYLPGYVRHLSLFVDVPLFFLVAGLMSSGKLENTIKRLLKLQITYVFLMFLICITIFCFSGSGLVGMFASFFHNYSKLEVAPMLVLHGSLWYMRVYFCVLFFGTLIIRYASAKEQFVISLLLFLTIVISIFINFIDVDVSYIIFYLFIFLVGHQLKNIRLGKFAAILSIVLILGASLFCYFYFGGQVLNIQANKFPPNLFYLIASSYSLFIILLLRGRVNVVKPNLITYMGQNALFFYIAQCISSSLLYFVLPYLRHFVVQKPLLLVCMFAINIAMAFPIMIIFKKYDHIAWKLFYKIRQLLA